MRPLFGRHSFLRRFVSGITVNQTLNKHNSVMTTNPSAVPPHTNRLACEKSPYLLQHAHNPVDWFAWGDEAFARACAENKPVFLSIGYSTCHWCHVMERESFEEEKVAGVLNEFFISIKVDREERPDVDRIYLAFVQAATGAGGWPLSVFLTPERKPFFGGTYFPPGNRDGRPGLLQVLRQIHEIWQTRRDEIEDSADAIQARLKAAAAKTGADDSRLTVETLQNAGEFFKQMHDPRHGGFGGAPKFPQPSVPALLLRCAKRFHDDEAARMVLHTCERMAAGGIHDQLGGGFARYSVDAGWLVPHFEKMLYDQAQLAQLYLDAHLVAEAKRSDGAVENWKHDKTNIPALQCSNAPFAAIARDILDYVLRDMTHPGGGFYSAEDADSEGHEGRFYCWTHDELSKLLSPEEFNVAARCFGITREGNFIDHSHPTPLPGQNVLSVVNPVGRDELPHIQADQQAGPADFELLASAKRKMLAARSKRVRPHLDDKILVSWNGLMLGAMARAYAILDDEKYRAAAEKNLAFIREKMWVAAGILPAVETGVPPGGQGVDNPKCAGIPDTIPVGKMPPSTAGGMPAATLHHRWRDGERDNVQLLEDYAFLLSGVVDLYEATLAPGPLDFAVSLAEAMIAKFYDTENGGFWQTTAEAKDLIVRTKDDYDGAEPSGNSVATLALLKMAAITGREDFRKPAGVTLRWFANRLQNFPQALPYMLQALNFSLEEPRRVVIAGDAASPPGRKLLVAAHSVYQPNKVVLGNTGAVEAFAQTLPASGGPVVYLCTQNSCLPPARDAAKVKEMLK
jgi:uncharacterized protein YyaL (SSP411 family)